MTEKTYEYIPVATDDSIKDYFELTEEDWELFIKDMEEMRAEWERWLESEL